MQSTKFTSYQAGRTTAIQVMTHGRNDLVGVLSPAKLRSKRHFADESE
jgi:hypothetical protein